ncbi:uncharacterized protein LOC127250383 [Andrographis paniculata]|uniref:uncharacterized protein LOC127250383 n=1 Tax=Andrographis paniculata TaxID=175694 RepID=UPI0021E8A7DD|nr:uncharacterized protein LOC127250383 [Andrographis paniculata]
MESAVKVALPAAVAEARLTGSAEGLGGGGGGGGSDVVVRELRLHKEDLCSLGGKKDDVHAANASEPPAWHKISNPELRVEVCRPSDSMHSNDASNDHGLQTMNPHSSDKDTKPLLQKSCKVIKYNSGYNKKSGVIQMEGCRSKTGQDETVVSPELASPPVISNISEKHQMAKQKSSTSRRGDKRIGKVKQKTKSDTLSLKNGLVAFNSAAGGSNFFGMYGLKPDVVDITKYASEQPLDVLLHGNYTCLSSGKDRGKTSSDSNNNLLQSVRKAWSIIQPRKVYTVQLGSETDSSSIQNFSSSMVLDNSEEIQPECDKVENCVADPPSSDPVQESDSNIKKFNLAETSLYQPKDMLDHIVLPSPKDLDLLLSETIKTSTPKNSTDARSVKPISNRTGLPPFSWSTSFSANSKLGSEAMKLSLNRAICQGGWLKVNNSPALHKDVVNLLEGFESLSFNQTLVPSFTPTSDRRECEITRIERALSTSSVCSTSKAFTDDYSQVCSAARTLLDLSSHSNGLNPCSTTKSLKRPAWMAMKAKSKVIERPKPFFNPPKPTIRSTIPIKAPEDGFPSKKPRPSSDIPDRYTEPSRKGTTLHWPIKSPPGKLFRDSNKSGTDAYPPNLVKKSISMKPPRFAERPPGHGSLQKFRKL